ncbi:MAG: hypothetical protein LC112_07775 [Flavobacteriales bacterium]|nr:hypothetical protein [Flavobacteriales bacterium]
MSKITNIFAVAALAIFEAHQLIDEIFITSDGQGFTDEEKAKDHARYHKDQTIKHFERGFDAGYQEENANPEATGKTQEADAERQNLVKEYTELFEKKPNHMTGVEKLKTAIADKKAELEAAKNADQGTSPEDLKQD